MFVALCVLAGIVFLVLAGFGVRGQRFAPEWQWFGFACLAVAGFHPILSAAF